MTFTPVNDENPDPAESAIEQIGESVEDARESVRSAREQALEAARSDDERAAINARFDAINDSVNESIGRIETAIATGNDKMVATMSGFLERLEATMTAGQGDTDDGIESIEEVTDDVPNPVEAAAAVGGAIETAVDEAPKRVHGLFKPLWGGSKE